MKSIRRIVTVLLLATPTTLHAADTSMQSQREVVKQILETTGVRGGLIVHEIPWLDVGL